MIVEVFPNNPLRVNTVFLIKDKECLVIDAGSREVLTFLKERNLKVVALINTHGHLDHTAGSGYLKEEFKVKFLMGKEDEFLLRDELFYGLYEHLGARVVEKIDEPLKEGELRLGPFKIYCLHTPGHTPGSYSFYLEEEKTLIVGDLLFKGSVGRWDLPGGNLKELKKSIRKIFKEFDLKTKVLCGHYQPTTLEEELRENHYVREFLNA